MAKPKIKMCIDKFVPDEKFVEAARVAIEENPLNAPITTQNGGNGHAGLEMAVLTSKRWKPGRTLKVKFLDGGKQIQRRVKKYAAKWQSHANIRFDFIDSGEAEIRIAFTPDGSWSYLGTDALVIKPAEPTMNFGWFDAHTPDHELGRTTLHEFGHALGCIHEHQHPDAGIPWDEAKVYEYYMGPPNKWSRSNVYNNLLKKYDHSVTNSSRYDPDSIMQYPVDNALTIGDWSVGWNHRLSSLDKEFIARTYPASKRKVPELEQGRELQASIGKAGEEDRFQFNIPSSGLRYSIETIGNTDVVMALFGPDDPTRLLDWDDDSGRNHNARITRTFKKGNYTVRIRHYSKTKTGNYSVLLQAAP